MGHSQDLKTSKLDTIRKQGYLIIGTDNLGKLSDVTPKFLFVPMENMEETIELTYVKNSQPNYDNLYIPTPYLFKPNELKDVNFYIKKHLNLNVEINTNQETIPIIDLLNKCSNLFRFKNILDKPVKTFKVVYLDGVWVKLKVPKKHALPISATYNETRLNKKDNNCLEYYFLIETKAISYNILFTDNSIEIVNE